MSSQETSDRTSRRSVLSGVTVGLAAATLAAKATPAQAQTIPGLSAEQQATLDKFNKSLDDANNYKAFVADPSAYASKYGVKIDASLSKQVSAALEGTKSTADVKSAVAKRAPSPAIALACIVGACAPVDTKIALVI